MLMHFLKTWNIKSDKYHHKTVGIPQNEFGDQSRILANLYLQNYDKNIAQFTENNNAKYMRFSDDQLIFIKDSKKINEIMYVVSRELNLLGLNLNAGKVRQYNKEQLKVFYGVEVFEYIKKEEYDEAVKIFFKYYKSKKYDFKYITPLRKFINAKIILKITSNYYKKRLIDIMTSESFLRDCDTKYLYKIYQTLTPIKKNKLIRKLNAMKDNITYNGFHYTLINFYTKINKLEYIDNINKRIEVISKL